MNKYLLLFIFLFAGTDASAQDLIWAKQFEGPGKYDVNITTIAPSGAIYSVGQLQGAVDFDPGTATYYDSATHAIAICKQDNNGQFIWVKDIKMGSSLFYPYGMSIDDSDNVIIVGLFSDTTDFDPGVGLCMLPAQGHMTDFFVVKLDSSGNFRCAQSYTMPSCYSVTTDDAGFIYMTGEMQGGLSDTVDFDAGPGVHPLIGGHYMFILKLDNAGNFVWVKRFGSTPISGQVTGSAIKVDKGYLYTTGQIQYLSAAVDFDPGPGVHWVMPTYTQDLFTLKLDTAGNFIWVKQIESECSGIGNFAYDIFIDGAGNVYTAGQFQDSTDFDPGPGSLKLVSSGGQYSAFVQKLDSAGNFIWAKHLAGPAQVLCIRVDDYQNIYSYGQFFSWVDFDPGPDTAIIYVDIMTHGRFLQKLDAAGNMVWVGKVDAGGFLEKFDLDSNNNLYISGHFYDSTDVDITSGTHMLTCSDASDSYILKLSTCSSFSQVMTSFLSPTSCSSNDGTITFYGLDSNNTYDIHYYRNGQPMPPINTGNTGNSFMLDSLSFGFYDSVTLSNAGCPLIGFGPFTLIAPCDSVWPGDVNYDMTADNNDVLDMLLVLGDTGSVRNNATTSWNAEYCSNWSTSQYNTVNTMHADCNGDGLISLADTLAVSANYGQVHPKGTHTQASPIPGLPDLYFDISNTVLTAGMPIIIPIKFGSAGTPVSNILGIAAQIKIEGADTAKLSIEANNSWMGSEQEMTSYAKIVDNARIDWVAGRTDKANVSGSGAIANLVLTLPADAANKKLNLYFDNVRVIDNTGRSYTGFNVIDLKMDVQPMNRAVMIYPNPSPGNVHIASQQDMNHIVITNYLGQVILERSLSGRYTSVDIAQQGVYFLRVSSGGMVTTEKVVIVK